MEISNKWIFFNGRVDRSIGNFQSPDFKVLEAWCSYL